MPSTTALVKRLLAAYPSHGFGLSDKDDCSASDYEDAPSLLITFTGPGELCILDPLSEGSGFSACDPLATYGISQEDAEAIRRHNRVALS